MANNEKENKIKKFTKEAIGKTLNQFNKEIGIADLVEINKNQDRILNGILSQVNDENTEKTEKSNIITLDNSTDGIVELKEIQGDTNVNVSKIEEMSITHDIGDKEGNVFTLNEIPKGAISIGEIQGNTMVNCNKEADKELILMEDLSTEGDNSIAITEGVDGGKVDVALEGNTLVNVSKTKDNYITHEREEDTTGNHVALADEGYIRPVLNGKTMVNVCDQKDPIAVTKSYMVENSGNHVALQDVIDGSCRPNIYGNTLVNLWDKSLSYATTGKGNFIKENNGVTVNNTSETGEFYVLNAGYISLLKPNTIYTLIIDIETSNNYQVFLSADEVFKNIGEGNTSTRFVKSFTSGNNSTRFRFDSDTLGGTVKFKDIMILEGDYTDKLIPDYFEGLQSSFEDDLVTQEMIDNGEEEESNLGKYKVEYRVTGKNLFDMSTAKVRHCWQCSYEFLPNGGIKLKPTATSGSAFVRLGSVLLKKGIKYTYKSNPSGNYYASYIWLGNDINKYESIDFNNLYFNEDTLVNLGLYVSVTSLDNEAIFYPQLEEGDTATSYEPYKEYTKTLYLNSPLLKDDTIEDRNGKATHIHRRGQYILNDKTQWLSAGEVTGDVQCYYTIDNYTTQDNAYCEGIELVPYGHYEDKTCFMKGQGVFIVALKNELLKSPNLDGFKDYLKNNPIKVVAKYHNATDETISKDSIVCDSYVSGHLDFNTAVPIENVEFKNTILENKYLYTNTEYTIQFEADKEGKAVISLGGTTLAETSIVRGLNKIIITTPETLTDNNLVLEGIGFNISDIVVTPTIEQDFEYFSGLSSAFESELITDETDEHYGKYKVDYRVTSKNKFKFGSAIKGGVVTLQNKDKTPILKAGRYTITSNCEKVYESNPAIAIHLANDKIITINLIQGSTFSAKDDIVTIYLYCNGSNYIASKDKDYTFTNIQIEEGNTATSYEPYKEYTKTLYLNSPLLEGDTIEEKDGSIYHVHRYNKVVLDGSDDENWFKYSANDPEYDAINITSVFSISIKGKKVGYKTSYCDNFSNCGDSSAFSTNRCKPGIYTDHPSLTNIYVDFGNNNSYSINDFKQWLQQNPTTVAYELASPTYELIEQSNLAIPSYSNGHLDLTSAVPISKVNFLHFEEDLTYLYPSTSYTVQFMSDKAISIDITLGGTQLLAQSIAKGLNRISITTPATLVDNKLVINGVGANISEVVITDTDRKFGYFEGMKSVGECKGNIIEIVSQNKNLFNGKLYSGWVSNNGVVNLQNLGSSDNILTDYIKVEKNKTYINNFNFTYVWTFDENKKFIKLIGGYFDQNPKNVGNASYAIFGKSISGQEIPSVDTTTVQIEEGLTATDYIPHQSNSQTLNHEPLRGVGNYRDRYVMIDGKWYIERNCVEFEINSSNVDIYQIWYGGSSSNGSTIGFLMRKEMLNVTPYRPDSNSIFTKSDTIKSISYDDLYYNDKEGTAIVGGAYSFAIKINKNKLTTPNESGFIQWLQNNPIKVIYIKNGTPTYEPIDYNPLEIYADMTHISTNSAIPTNITIKNHGYNCLLKPSTTYTVSSSRGINTVTTGADIGDSCLRFYNEDTSNVTTMKDVLVLEGDWTSKANLIPSNFSGIKSVFEQELVTDENDEYYGKYKVVAKIIGKNLFDESSAKVGYYWRGDNILATVENSIASEKYLKVVPGMILLANNQSSSVQYMEYDSNKNFIQRVNKAGGTSYKVPNNVAYLRFSFYASNNTNFQIEQVENECVNSLAQITPHEPYKESNVTFYIDEPLRGTKNVKDRVYIKDDKVIVQRNCDSITLDGSRDEWYIWETDNNIIRFALAIDLKCPYHSYTNPANYIIIDKFNRIVYSNNKAKEGFLSHISETIKWIAIAINKYKLATPDVAGFRQWLQQNPVTIVYQLAEPTYEEVEFSSNRLILNTFNNESFNNSTLFLDTNISPKLSFKPLWEELVYVKNSTKYYIQFNAVGSGEVVINLGGTELTTEIVEGYNCIPITTPSESTNLMTIIGQGITISEVVVSEVICGGYYKGLQSCFEEHMENGKYRILLRGIALDGSKVNGIKLYINEPLRGIGNIKDRLCIKDGKLMVERKCGEVVLDGSEQVVRYNILENVVSYRYDYTTFPNAKNGSQYELKCNNFKYNAKYNDNSEFINFAGAIVIISVSKTKTPNNNPEELKQFLSENPTTVVYQLKTPVYEEAINEYGLPIVLEGYENGIVYIDSAVTPTTHIKYTSNNQLATTLAEAEEQNIATQEDINMNVITYMMDIDMMLTDMEMSNDISVMAVRRDSSNENMLDRMSDEDKKVYRDNTVVMLEKMITANVLDKEDIEGRVDMYYDKNRISKEQYKYLKSLL